MKLWKEKGKKMSKINKNKDRSEKNKLNEMIYPEIILHGRKEKMK